MDRAAITKAWWKKQGQKKRSAHARMMARAYWDSMTPEERRLVLAKNMKKRVENYEKENPNVLAEEVRRAGEEDSTRA